MGATTNNSDETPPVVDELPMWLHRPTFTAHARDRWDERTPVDDDMTLLRAWQYSTEVPDPGELPQWSHNDFVRTFAWEADDGNSYQVVFPVNCASVVTTLLAPDHVRDPNVATWLETIALDEFGTTPTTPAPTLDDNQPDDTTESNP